MTLNDIQEEVIYLMGGEPVNLATITKYTNKCMETLSGRYDTACIKKSAQIIYTDVLYGYPLPADCIGVYGVKNKEFPYDNYFINQEGINFGEVGVFTIEYYATPVLTVRKNYDLNIKTDVPPINILYHKCIPKYIACELSKISNPKGEVVQIFFNDFSVESQEANQRIKTLKRKGRRIKAPVWG